MSARIELVCGLKSDLGREIGLEGGFVEFLGKQVQVGDVGLMVLLVVQLHNLGRNHGF